MKSAIVIVTSLITSFYLLSFAGEPSNISVTERNKAKIVSRLYQATFGSIERCQKATPDAAKEFENELHRFVDLNANLVNLVTQSPHYNDARKKFSHHETMDPARDNPESLAGECKYLALLLRSMNDSPDGKNAVKEYEAQL